MSDNKIAQKGFTIVEIAIVMIVAGSLLAFLASALIDFQQKRRIEITEYRLEQIKDGISNYLSKTGKLPCPASRIINPANINFGREYNAVLVPGSTDCRAAPADAHTARVAGTRNAANFVRVGSVPVRDIDLEDTAMVDGWGNRFTYAVTEVQATIVAPPLPVVRYDSSNGEINVIDLLGNTVLGAAGTAHYVVISHGEDQQGAINVTSNLVLNIGLPCNGAVTNVQSQNCVNEPLIDNDAIFLETFQRGNDIYDDYMIYAAQNEQDTDIPTGAVMPFNLQNCPEGWTVFEEAQGRFVMGVVDPAYATSIVFQTTWRCFIAAKTKLSLNRCFKE